MYINSLRYILMGSYRIWTKIAGKCQTDAHIGHYSTTCRLLIWPSIRDLIDKYLCIYRQMYKDYTRFRRRKNYMYSRLELRHSCSEFSFSTCLLWTWQWNHWHVEHPSTWQFYNNDFFLLSNDNSHWGQVTMLP